MVLVACYTLFLSKERSRWWGITFLGKLGMGREGEGTGGKIFLGLAAFGTPLFASGRLFWWGKICQGAGGIMWMYDRVRVRVEEVFSGWAKLGVLLVTRFFQGERMLHRGAFWRWSF